MVNSCNMKVLTILFTTSLILFSCNLNQNAGEAEYALKKMHTEVMEIHDEVMPRMSDIGKLKKQLKEKLNSPETTKQDSIQQLIYQLEEADNAMMDWMGNFKKPNYKEAEAAEKVYLSEKKKIIVVRDKMNSTISAARLFLDRL